jgi:hypothetical protein
MVLENIVWLLVVAIIVIVLLVVLFHLLGYLLFIGPEAGLIHHQFVNYGVLSMDKTGDLLLHGAHST